MTSMKEKKRFVELNMAEANERLKYLVIDYEKYKNRPQLDYGTIEEGYENLMTSADFDKETDDEEEEEEDDFEDDEDVYESKKRGRGSFAAATRKKEEEKVQDDNSQEDDPFLMGKRRTRARTAATLASFLFQTLPRSSRRKRNQKPTEEETKNDDDKTSVNNDDKSSDSKSPITTSESPQPSSPFTRNCDQRDIEMENLPTKNLKECLKERPSFLNSTQGFQNLIDIWSVEKSDLQSIDENCVSLMESSAVLQRAVKWKSLNKEINPMVCDEQEYIDETEMIIHNAEFAIKMEDDLSAIKDEESSTAMEVDQHEETVVADKIEEVEETVAVHKHVDCISNVLEESILDKVIEHEPAEIEQNKETPTVEENNSEGVNSNKSTAAYKDSEEVSESNIEMYSKRNSINNNHKEMQIQKIMENKDLNKQIETTTEHKESTETEQEKINEEKLEEAEIDLETNKHEKENEKFVLQENETNNLEKESECNENPSNDIEASITDELEKINLENLNKAGEEQDKQEENKGLPTESTTEKATDMDPIEKDFDKFTSTDRAINQAKGNSEETLKTFSEEQEVNAKKSAKDFNDISLDEDKYLQEETNSKDATNTEAKTCQILVNEEAIKTEDSRTEETNLESKANTEDYFTTGKVANIDSSETLPIDNKESLSQSLQDDSNIIFHYSSDSQTENLVKSELGGEATVVPEEYQESTDSDTQHLKNLCLTKNVKVLVRKLCSSDLTSLRQPKVKIQRVNYEKYAEEFRTKRRRIAGRAYLDIDDSSNSNNSYGTNSTSSHDYRPTRLKRKVPIRRHSMRHSLRASESDNDSTNSDDLKLSTMVLKTKICERRLSTPSSSRSSTLEAAAAASSSTKRASGPKSARYTAGPKSTRNTAGPKSSKHNLIVTPRSASGLKLRISNAEQTIVYDDVIQLSSSSSDACILNELSPIVEEFIAVEDHPLFEEEIII